MTPIEGAATDWLPLLMVDGHDMPPGLGSLVYATTDGHGPRIPYRQAAV